MFLKIYLFILGRTFLLAYICSNFRIFCVSVVLVVTCFSFLILFRSQFFLVSLVKGLSILFVFSKNQLLVSFFSIFFFFSLFYFLLLFPSTVFGIVVIQFFLVLLGVRFSSVQLLSCVQLFATPWTAGHQASLSITNSWSLLKLMSTESVMPSNHLILCCPLLLLPSTFPSIGVFSNESVLRIRWPKYWSFSFSISPSNGWLKFFLFREVGH